MSTGLYTRLDFDSENSRFIPRQNKTRSFEYMVMSFISNEHDQNVKLKASLQQVDKKTDSVSVDGFCSYCNTVYEAMGCFYHFCPCQKRRPPLTEEDIQRGSKKRVLNLLRRHCKQAEGFTVIEMWEGEWWRLYNTTNTVKQHIREHFPYRRLLAAEQVLEEIAEGKLFGYLQCAVRYWSTWKFESKFVNLPPKFKNTLVSKRDIGALIKNYAEE